MGKSIYLNDDILAYSIRDQLGGSETNIEFSKEELEKVYYLYLKESNCNYFNDYLMNLEGIEKLINLERLVIKSCYNIKDFSVIKKLKNLNSLTITDTKINDISFIESLPNLSSLDITDNVYLDLENKKNSKTHLKFYKSLLNYKYDYEEDY